MSFSTLRSSTVKRWFAFLALSVMLFGAIAPTVSRAMATKGNGWMEVCTVKGIQWVAMDDGKHKPADDQQHLVQNQHCPFCSPHHASIGLPPVAETSLTVPPSIETFYPERFFTSARPLFIWASANPRAPPSFSA